MPHFIHFLTKKNHLNEDLYGIRKGPIISGQVNTIFKTLSKFFGKSIYYKGKKLPTFLTKLSVFSLSFPPSLPLPLCPVSSLDPLSLPPSLSLLFNIIVYKN